MHFENDIIQSAVCVCVCVHFPEYILLGVLCAFWTCGLMSVLILEISQ